MDDPVARAEERIREIVTSPRRRDALMRNPQEWGQLTSALDAVGDTQLAVRAYIDEDPDPDVSTGRLYLLAHGLLQALYVQQDATIQLGRRLGVPLALPAEIQAIREDRNDAVGHPAVRRTSISRFSLSENGFLVAAPGKSGRDTFRYVDFRAAAERHTVLMGELLDGVVEGLVSEERAHRGQFRATPLASTMPDSLSYACEKISAGIHRPAEKSMAVGGIDTIRRALSELRQRLDDRDLAGAYVDTIGKAAKDVEFALDRLAKYFANACADWTPHDADVYQFYLVAEIKNIRQMTESIDRDYASDDVP